METLVQFMHPGKEHRYASAELAQMKKNKVTDHHERNFIFADGEYVDTNGNLESGELTFWGEWDNEAGIKTVYNNVQNEFPHALITPIVPKHQPVNTDPFVFGDCFKYFCCQQNRGKRLRNLDEGDIILFGSHLNKKFVIDTVFVVAKAIQYTYTSSGLSKVQKVLSQEDYELFYKSSLSFNRSSCKPKTKGCSSKKVYDTVRTFYIGATYKNPIDGMYSFSPSQLESVCNKHGFKRVSLQDFGIGISDGLTQGHKIIVRKKTKKVWNSIVARTQNAGCVLGVRFFL